MQGAEHGGQNTMDSPTSSRKRWVAALTAVLAGGALGAGGWFGTDALERDNDFCNACHLDGWTSGTPLHTEHRDQFAATALASPGSLASAHAAAGHPERVEGSGFRCIDCHGGVGFVGRAQVKVLAAKDAFWWVTGRFEEPDGMHWPLRDADCSQCHASFETKAAAYEDPAFHDLALHNSRLGVDCVECHSVHEAVDNPNWYLDTAHVREQCARCHSEFAGS